MTIDPVLRTQIVVGAVTAATAKLLALTAQAAGTPRGWTGCRTWTR